VCRIAELEKDLYYYKMTSREFKKKLRSRESVKSEHDETDVGGSRDVAAGGDAAISLRRASSLFLYMTPVLLICIIISLSLSLCLSGMLWLNT